MNGTETYKNWLKIACMACKSVTKEATATLFILSPSDYHLFAGLKQNLGSHKFKDDRDVDIFVSRRLITSVNRE